MSKTAIFVCVSASICIVYEIGNFNNPWYLIGAFAMIYGIIGAIVFFRRRKKDEKRETPD